MDVDVYGVLDSVWCIVYKFLIIKDVFFNLIIINGYFLFLKIIMLL